MTRLACPTCRSLLDVPAMPGALVTCPCGADLFVRVDVGGFHLAVVIVDRSTISLAMEHLR